MEAIDPAVELVGPGSREAPAATLPPLVLCEGAADLCGKNNSAAERNGYAHTLSYNIVII